MKIVIADPDLRIHRALFEAALAPDMVISWHDAWDDPSVLVAVEDADVYVGPRLTAAMGAAGSRLRLVHRGAGYDGIDLDALPTRTVCANTRWIRNNPWPPGSSLPLGRSFTDHQELDCHRKVME